MDEARERADYGLLGLSDFDRHSGEAVQQEGLGIADRMINSIFNSMVNTINKQMQNQFREMKADDKAEIVSFPNGIKIKISGQNNNVAKQKQKQQKREISAELIRRINSLPKSKARGSMKRIGNKVYYEIAAPGIVSTDDVLVSKLESGYEVKAIGKKKVYVNSIPINLPLKSYSISDTKLLMEFSSHEDN